MGSISPDNFSSSLKTTQYTKYMSPQGAMKIMISLYFSWVLWSGFWNNSLKIKSSESSGCQDENYSLWAMGHDGEPRARKLSKLAQLGLGVNLIAES